MTDPDLTQQTNGKLAIYIASFDGYSDLWEPFFELFWKFWPDCPYDVYLGANSKDFDDDRVTILRSPNDAVWSDRARHHLEQIDHDYVLVMLDDWFVEAPVDAPAIARLVEIFDIVRGHAIRLMPDPKPTLALGGLPEIGLMGLGIQNRTSTQATIWRRTSLLQLLRDGESLWEFEVYGAARSNMWSGGVFSVWTAPIKYFGAVDAGKFTRAATRYLERNNVTYAPEKRATKSFYEQSEHTVRNKITDALRLVLSHRARQKLRSFVEGRDAFALRK